MTFSKYTPEIESPGQEREERERKTAALGDDAGLLFTDAAHLVSERVESECIVRSP